MGAREFTDGDERLRRMKLVGAVGSRVYGPMWQTPLAEAIAKATGRSFGRPGSRSGSRRRPPSPCPCGPWISCPGSPERGRPAARGADELDAMFPEGGAPPEAQGEPEAGIPRRNPGRPPPRPRRPNSTSTPSWSRSSPSVRSTGAPCAGKALSRPAPRLSRTRRCSSGSISDRSTLAMTCARLAGSIPAQASTPTSQTAASPASGCGRARRRGSCCPCCPSKPASGSEKDTTAAPPSRSRRGRAAARPTEAPGPARGRGCRVPGASSRSAARRSPPACRASADREVAEVPDVVARPDARRSRRRSRPRSSTSGPGR